MMKNNKKKPRRVLGHRMRKIEKSTMRKMMKINIKTFHQNLNLH